MKAFMIAGAHSGCGKTTVTLGILAALGKRGLSVQPFKAGPDFIDTGLHGLITGRPSRNLDLWMCGEEYVKKCFSLNSETADVSVVEGVMGLYDGDCSSASLAAALNIPVILVVDAYGMAESAGAVVKGFRDFGLLNEDCGIHRSKIINHKSGIAGVIFNRIASERHYERVKAGVRDVPVLGYLPRDLDFEIPHRHLGLVTAEETPFSREAVDKLSDAILKHVDLNDVLDRAAMPAGLEIPEPVKAQHEARLAVAYDKAFCFYYEDNLDLLREEGAELVFFSPLSDACLPEGVDAVFLGGGYPELHAADLSSNRTMLRSVHAWAAGGGPVYAECGGLMYLSKGVLDFDGGFFPMAGVLPFETGMKRGRSRLGYREVRLKEDCLLGLKGDKLRGHEFHYSAIEEGGRLSWDATGTGLVYSVSNGSGDALADEGYSFKNTLASYVHIHFGSNAGIGRRFIDFIGRRTKEESSWKT